MQRPPNRYLPYRSSRQRADTMSLTSVVRPLAPARHRNFAPNSVPPVHDDLYYEREDESAHCMLPARAGHCAFHDRRRRFQSLLSSAAGHRRSVRAQEFRKRSAGSADSEKPKRPSSAVLIKRSGRIGGRTVARRAPGTRADFAGFQQGRGRRFAPSDVFGITLGINGLRDISAQWLTPRSVPECKIPVRLDAEQGVDTRPR